MEDLLSTGPTPSYLHMNTMTLLKMSFTLQVKESHCYDLIYTVEIFSWTSSVLLADLGEPRGCFTNAIVINKFSHSLIFSSS